MEPVVHGRGWRWISFVRWRLVLRSSLSSTCSFQTAEAKASTAQARRTRGHLGGGPRANDRTRRDSVSETKNKEEKRRGKQRRKETEERNVLKVDRLSVGRDRPTFDLRIECCLLFLEDTSLHRPCRLCNRSWEFGSGGVINPPVLPLVVHQVFSRMWPMSHCQNDICTRTQKIHKCRQIKTHQSTTRRTNKTTRNPPARFAFRQEKQQTRHTKGARAQTTNPRKGFAKRHSGLYHCVTLKNMPKLIIHHDMLRNIEIEALRVASLS